LLWLGYAEQLHFLHGSIDACVANKEFNQFNLLVVAESAKSGYISYEVLHKAKALLLKFLSHYPNI
jgi:hypothetical protein